MSLTNAVFRSYGNQRYVMLTYVGMSGVSKIAADRPTFPHDVLVQTRPDGNGKLTRNT